MKDLFRTFLLLSGLINLIAYLFKQEPVFMLAASFSFMYSKLIDIEEQKDILINAHLSISKNSCCNLCREASLVSKKALKDVGNL